MKLWCFDDHQNWGKALYACAYDRGIDARMFSDARKVDDGYCFVHMWHNPKTRARDKAVMDYLSLRPKLTLIPEYRSARLYDDKVAQARDLAKWMPRTFVVTRPEDLHEALDTLEFPFMSKASEGAGSYNVRLINTPEEAKAEYKAAMGSGVQLKYGQVQAGYLLWQEFCKDNPGDLRIISVGRTRMILKRKNRKDRPMASGSGMIEPLRNKIINDRDIESALIFADRFFREERFTWCGIDLVRHHVTKEWKVLETTVGWTFAGYLDCLFYGDDKGRTGKHTWDVLLDEIERGNFECSLSL